MSKPLEQGDRLGDYEIVAVAGFGGMGIVYKARQQSLDRVVALKVIRDEIASEPEYRQRFMREARLAASVDHPHVVTVYDVGSEDERLYLAMQWIDGVDLKKQLQESGRLSPKRAVAIGTQLAGALDALHGVSGLIHRDVKPANVLIREVAGEDHAYLTDFGIAKPPEGVDDLTKTGSTLGTTGYLSPEQIQGRKSGPRSDLYALGCLVFEMLTGQQPFRGENETAVRWAHANDPRPLVSESLPALGQRYDHFFSIALAVEPGERFGSGRELAEALARAQSSDGETAATSIIPPPRAATKTGPPAPVAVPNQHPPAPPGYNPQTPAPGHQPPPGYQPYGYVTPQPPPRDRSGNPLALVLLAIVALAGIAVGILAVAGAFSSGGATKTMSTSAALKRRQASSRGSTPIALPSGAKPCGGGVSVGPATTCPFARNVQRAFDASDGSATIDAYSPVTGETYTMHCTGSPTTVCRGGKDAAVYLTLGASTPEESPSGPAATPSQSPSLSLSPCDENVSAGSATSCPFAENVFVSYWEEYEAHGEQSATYVSAYSPATRHTYGMSCSLEGGTVSCSGGNEALVTFPIQAVRDY
jgi:serine/threonine protein kinase